MNEQVFGIFSTADAAEHAIAALKDHGVPGQDISVLHRADGTGAPEVESVADHALTSTSSGDAVAGAMKGGSAGLLLGVLGGALAITIPGIGPVLAAGPIWAAVSAALATTAAGAISGGTVGFLVDQGVPEAAATHFHDAISRGEFLVSVRSAHISDTEAITIFEKYGANMAESESVGLREVPPYENSETSVLVVEPIEPVVITGEAIDWPPARHVALPEDPLDEEGELLEPIGAGAAA